MKKNAEFDLVSLLFGAGIKLRERGEEVLDEMIKQGEDWAKDWKEKLVTNREELGDENGEEDGNEKSRFRAQINDIKDGLNSLLKQVGVVTADDLKVLESRIDRLSAKLEKRNK